MWEELRSMLLNYVGTGWTVTGHPIGIGYLSMIENASPQRLIEIADELGIEVIIRGDNYEIND